MYLTRILLRHGGQARQRTGGCWQQKILIGWEDLSGLVLITAVNQHLSDGRISIRILVLWICVGFLKIFITTTKVGGRIKMYYTFLHIGTCLPDRQAGEIKGVSRLMYG